MKENLRQSMPVATRLEDGEILRTEEDHARAAAAAAAETPAAAKVADNDNTSTPADSGAGEELIENG